MPESGLTIGRLARAANVGVETVRYYQQLSLLPIPEPTDGAFRIYPVELIDRIQFIKRAQELGFSLEEIGTFLQLQDGTNRQAIRKVATERLQQIRAKIADLKQMENVLSGLVQECEVTGKTQPCPIITALQIRNDH